MEGTNKNEIRVSLQTIIRLRATWREDVFYAAMRVQKYELEIISRSWGKIIAARGLSSTLRPVPFYALFTRFLNSSADVPT